MKKTSDIPEQGRRPERGEQKPRLPLGLRGIALFTRYLRTNIISFDFPLNQVGVLIAVYAQGDAGATYADISEFLGGLSPGSVSKNIARLSQFTLPPPRGSRAEVSASNRLRTTERAAGYSFLRVEVDLSNRKFYRVFLTPRGRELVNVLEACLSGEFSSPSDLPRSVPDGAFDPFGYPVEGGGKKGEEP